jgi:hypothetical protein
MKYELTVTKDASGELIVSPQRLDVDPLPQGVHLIQWTLDPESLPTAEFADEPLALQWQPPKLPEYHVFRRYRLSPDRRVLTVLDRNQDSQTQGEYKYQLAVIEPDASVGQRLLSSGTQMSNGRPINNPIIINR